MAGLIVALIAAGIALITVVQLHNHLRPAPLVSGRFGPGPKLVLETPSGRTFNLSGSRPLSWDELDELQPPGTYPFVFHPPRNWLERPVLLDYLVGEIPGKQADLRPLSPVITLAVSVLTAALALNWGPDFTPWRLGLVVLVFIGGLGGFWWWLMRRPQSNEVIADDQTAAAVAFVQRHCG